MSTEILDPDSDFNMSPELVAVTTSYIATSDIGETARALNIPKEKVSYYINKPEAKRFIDTVFLEQGYLNRHKLQDVLSEVIELKLEEMRESELGSNKDILDLLAFAHKIGTDTRKEIIENSKLNAPKVQINKQTNISQTFGENYGNLMEKLVGEN